MPRRTLPLLLAFITLIFPMLCTNPADAAMSGTYIVTLSSGGAESVLTCFARQNDNNVAVTCESAAASGTCGLWIATLRGTMNGSTVSLTGTAPNRKADCSVNCIETLSMTLTMNGSVTATGTGRRGSCTGGGDTNYTVTANRTGVTPIDRSQDLDRNGSPELLWQNLLSSQIKAWYMDGKSVLQERIVTRASSLDMRMVAAADFNSDGSPDLLLHNRALGIVTVVMLKDGVRVSEANPLTISEPYWRSVGIGDFNGDGYPDLLLHHMLTGAIYLYYWNGTSFVNGTHIDTVRDTSWKIVGVGDFNYDNRPDILWHNQVTSRVAVWYMNDTTVTGVAILDDADPAWHAQAVMDLNNDGHPDILWRNISTGAVSVWYMNGTHRVVGDTVATVGDHNWQLAGGQDYTLGTTFPVYHRILWRNQATGDIAAWVTAGTSFKESSGITRVADLNWKPLAAGDFNKDYWGDILWQHETTGETAVWLMSHITLQESLAITRVADTNWKIAGAGDFDDDGNDDILWRNQATGEVALWLMNGTSIASTVSLGRVPLSWRIGGVGSFYLGKMNVFWQNNATGEVAVWQMNGTTLEGAKMITTLADKNWRMVGVMDFNADGTRDLLWQHLTTGEVVIWLLTESSAIMAVRSVGTVPDTNWKIMGAF